MSSSPLFRFQARTETGDARGRVLGFPTINFRLEDVPSSLQEGIYACRVDIDGTTYAGALHHGPRPAVQKGVACEVHLLDTALSHLPERAEVQIIARIRDVLDFPSPEDLAEQIARDVVQTRTILDTHKLSGN